MGTVGVGAEVGAGVIGTTVGVTTGGFGGVILCISCNGCPYCEPVLPVWTTLVGRIDCVCSVGVRVKRTFFPGPVSDFLRGRGRGGGGFGVATRWFPDPFPRFCVVAFATVMAR
jgi:hypothetical protein